MNYSDNENNNEISLDKAILVSICTKDSAEFKNHIEEMENLIKACNMQVVAKLIQPMENPNPATYLGSGKLIELSNLVRHTESDYCIFADTLSPAQLKNITNEVDCSVLDRTGLILQIFAMRAKTREARLQVESANLSYMLPRLVGMRTSLGRQGGGSGRLSNKGQGEKQIDLDKRHIEKRMTELKRELDSISHNREVLRKQRNKGNIKNVALTGYTNAGKSTLMNYLINISGADIEKEVFAKNMLFATLDTQVRRIKTSDNKDFLLSDTVGFVSNLPHSLIKAFRSTLEEIKYADLILVIIDASDEHYLEQIEITENTLREIKAHEIPKLYIMNKSDCLDEKIQKENTEDKVYISAKTGYGIDELLNIIKSKLYSDNKEIDIIIPYDKGHIVNQLNVHAHILSQEYEETGIHIKADCPLWLYGQLFR